MKIFLSWSGDLSREVASLLKTYLPVMLQDVDVFTSQHDIPSGERWSHRIAKTLEDTNFGIVLLSHGTLARPWLLFEAGALTKHLDGRACCLLLGDLSFADVMPPLSQFENRRFIKTEVRQLLSDINQLVERPLQDSQVELVFEKFWPDLDSRYQLAIRTSQRASNDPPPRAQQDLIQEILVTVREIARRGAPPMSAPADLLSNPLTPASLAEYTNWRFPGRGVSELWQRRLLSDLDLTKYPSLRHLDDAIAPAKNAVEAYAAEAPDLFVTGTDFITKSLGFVDTDFRNHHSWAPQTRRAFDKYADLVRTV